MQSAQDDYDQFHGRCAFLGPEASYTHQAAISYYKDDDYTLIPQPGIGDVFKAVQDGDVCRGVVPFENSSNGSVILTLDLFADLQNKYHDIIVTGEIYLPVQHCLVGRLPKVEKEDVTPTSSQEPDKLPNRDLKEIMARLSAAELEKDTPKPTLPRNHPAHDIKHITKVYTHPQAWGQCKVFMGTYMKGIERQDISSTSKAAELVAQDETHTSAAISSRMAAEMNKLTILASGIEDNQTNSTRFLVIRKRSGAVESAHQRTFVEEDVEMALYKTLVSFTVSHESPGALADCLAIFKKYKLNLTSINSRPGGEAPWMYKFFVELRGRMHATDIKGPVDLALDDLAKVATGHRWLGSWEDALLNVKKAR